MKKWICHHTQADGPVGFEFLPANFGDKWGQLKGAIFIYSTDFEVMLSTFKQAYPILDPETQNTDDYFDYCGANPIHKAAWFSIVDELSQLNIPDQSLKDFIQKFCLWVLAQLEWADEIIVFGNQ